MFNTIKLAGLSCLLFLTAATFPTTIGLEDDKENPVLYKIMEVSYLWDLLEDVHEPNRTKDGSWLEEGLRSKYAAAKKYASILVLEELTGKKVFLKGPHAKGLNFDATDSFGYYNPEFLRIIEDNLKAALQHPAYRKVAEDLYFKHFEGMITTYYNAYSYAQDHPQQMRNHKLLYLEQVTAPNGTINGSLQETFRSYADKAAKEENANWYEAVTAPSFWIRRSIDGTDEQFINILTMVIDELGAKG